ncbi:MAG: 2-amino-4-oxopentanoate thiolase subunit OrtA, partial [Eubacteriales bacterium]|nr:2-amino-4-oxopentanoate thiolase subunit OrtA [Eubacteriales bacterium]
VVIEVEILTPEQRAPQIPEDTKETSLIALYKGYLQNETANEGDVVTIKTAIGREVEGVLTTRDTSPTHTYGKVVPELLEAHKMVRDFVFEGEDK